MVDQFMLGDEEISNWVKQSKVIESVTRIPGDASARKYYRVVSDSKSYVVMWMEPFAQHKENLPFLTVQKHLSDSGVDVPSVLDVDPTKGFILLEDLGDVTLLRKLQGVHSRDTERHLYEKAIDSLIQLQVFASPRASNRHVEAFALKFDFEKLMWEVNYTIENLYKIYLSRNIKENDHALIVKGFSDICRFLASQPMVLAHRDFHSRNVMLTSGKDVSERFVMIDFQDARMGPRQYDLASLLKDSYYQLDEKQIETLIDYYIARFEAVSGESLEREEFVHVFDLMSIQRNFKAIGSFASFMNRRGDASYLKFIGNTFENIRRVLSKYPEYSDLKEILFHYYYF